MASVPSDFVVNTDSAVVHNVYLDAERAERELSSLLVLDAEHDLSIKEENPFVTVTVFCQTWLRKAFGCDFSKDNRKEVLREVVTTVLQSDEADKNLLDYTETYTDITTLTVHHEGEATIVEKKRKNRTRIRKGYRSLFAASMANEAKIKFGNLVYNDANVMMVRRWLSAMISTAEYKDMRNVDKVLALDRATFMTFVVSEDYKRYEVLFDDKKMQDRLLMRFGASE